MKKAFFGFGLAALLSGCAVQPGSNIGTPSSAKLEVGSLYLRGTFNWWGVQEAYRFKSAGEIDTWYVEIPLIDDNVLYDFKLADVDWSPTHNCGVQHKKTEVSPSAALMLYCGSDSANLQFLPNGNGNYRFLLTRSDSGVYRLSVSKI